MKNIITDKKHHNDNLKTALLFILPSVLGCIIFIFLPSAVSLILSFCDWNLINNISFKGLDNYSELMLSKEFWLILKNTIIYALSVTILGTIIPIILAAVIHAKVICRNFFKTTYFLPFITPMIVIAMIWQWIFDPNIGLINSLCKSNLQWLYDSNLAMPVLIMISVWKLIGYNMIICLSGFSSINTQIYEAAKIDGAGKINTFF